MIDIKQGDCLELMKECRKAVQKMFEKEHSREEFIKLFGKNYLGDETD